MSEQTPNESQPHTKDPLAILREELIQAVGLNNQLGVARDTQSQAFSYSAGRVSGLSFSVPLMKQQQARIDALEAENAELRAQQVNKSDWLKELGLEDGDEIDSLDRFIASLNNELKQTLLDLHDGVNRSYSYRAVCDLSIKGLYTLNESFDPNLTTALGKAVVARLCGEA